MDDQALGNLRARCFEAATGERGFADVVEHVTHAFGAGGGVVFEVNRKTGQLLNWVSPSLEIGGDSYSEHINAINPRMHFSMAHAPGHVAFEGRFISPDQMRRHEFYDWLKAGHDFELFLGSRLLDEGDVSVFHSVEFGAGRPHPEREEIQRFSLAAKTVATAWTLAKRQGRGGDSQWAPNHLPWAIFALNSAGEVIEVNDLAAQTLRNHRFLEIHDRTLLTTMKATRRRFAKLVSDALAGHRGEILLSDPLTRSVATLQSVPTLLQRLTDPTAVVAQLYLWDPGHGAEGQLDRLQALWGLTKVEAVIATHLGQGDTLDLAADALAISRNTARNHLQNVFAKMGVNRQGEVIRRVLSLLGQSGSR